MTIVSLSTTDLFGGSRFILARVTHEGQEVEITFDGRQKGRPGHVKVKVDGVEVPVPFPEQYGSQFNEDWVRAYWEKNTGQEA